jgi:hypothetical protein
LGPLGRTRCPVSTAPPPDIDWGEPQPGEFQEL